jgi:hypothetical protein
MKPGSKIYILPGAYYLRQFENTEKFQLFFPTDEKFISVVRL